MVLADLGKRLNSAIASLSSTSPIDEAVRPCLVTHHVGMMLTKPTMPPAASPWT